MPFYNKLGSIPEKRHTQFRKPDGTLYHEELFSTEGFSNTYSLLYHLYPPTKIKQVGEAYSVEPKVVLSKQLKHRSLHGFKITPADDYLESRKAVLVNSDLHISLAAPRKSMTDYFYKNDTDKCIGELPTDPENFSLNFFCLLTKAPGAKLNWLVLQ